MVRSILCHSIIVPVVLLLAGAGTCSATDSIVIESPVDGNRADGSTIKPEGSSTLYGTGYITVKITNYWYINGQLHSATHEVNDITPDEFGNWEYPDDVTLHGPGNWSVSAFFTAVPGVYDVNSGTVSAPP